MLSQLYPLILQQHLHQQRVLSGHSMITILCQLVPMHRSLALLILREFYPYLLDNGQVIPMQYFINTSGLIINLLNCMSCTCVKSLPIENSIFIAGEANQYYACYSCTCPFKISPNRGLFPPIGYNELFLFEYSFEQIIQIHSQLSNILCSTNNVFINELLSTELDYIKDLFSIEVFHEILSSSNNDDSLFEINDVRMLRVIHMYMYLLIVFRFKNYTSNDFKIHIADIFNYYFPLTSQYYTHLAQQLPFNKHKLDLMKVNNPLLIQQCEKHDLSRRLELQSWLNRCTTRLARYSLLMGTICKKCLNPLPMPKSATKACRVHSCLETEFHIHVEPDFDPFIEHINYNRCMDIIKDIMFKVNHNSGISENRVQLQNLKDNILESFKTFNLQLNNPNQLLIRQGPLKRRTNNEIEQIHVLLLANCFVVLRRKKLKFKISGRPLLLPLIDILHNSLSISGIVGASRWLNIARRNMDDKQGIVRKYNNLISKRSFKRTNSRHSMDVLFSRNSSGDKLDKLEIDSISAEHAVEHELDKIPSELRRQSDADATKAVHISTELHNSIEDEINKVKRESMINLIDLNDDLLDPVGKKVNDFIIGDDDFIMRDEEKDKIANTTSLVDEKSSRTSLNDLMLEQSTESELEFTISYLGHHSNHLTFICASIADKKSWIDAILQQQKQIKKDMNQVVDSTMLNVDNNGIIYCAHLYNDILLMGCIDGIYIGYFHTRAKSEPLLLLNNTSETVLDSLINCKQSETLTVAQCLLCDLVTQIEIISSQLVFMVDKTVYCIGLSELPLKMTMEFSLLTLTSCKKLSAHVSFFKTGISGSRPLVCVVKSTSLSSTIKAYEPTELNSQKGISKFFKTQNDSVKLYRELYIPSESTNIHFLKTKLCVGCTRGFEIVDLESLLTQGLLDPEDEDLGFAIKVDHLQPIALYRAFGFFLLCYNGHYC
eukprot:NODE_183_length_15731_cov_0.226778.p1 type:complete len:945 gc:universal NODE_183_length_15731_cov_0.226778:6110-3276(-)